MRALTIWILQTGEPLHVDAGEPRPMRAMNVANALVAAGHRVVIWSAAFSHQEKRHRSRRRERAVISENLEYRLIPSPGYARNMGLGRLWDHAVLGANLHRLLCDEVVPPDVCLIGYPPIETAAVMARWLKKRGVPSLLDVKDQWPVLFLDSLPKLFRIPGRIVLAPYYFLARRAINDATGVSAMAEGFLRWALQFGGRSRSRHDFVAPLTSPRNTFGEHALASAREWWAVRGVCDDGRVRFCFVGSQTRSFDFITVAEAARRLAASNPSCELVICGTGERSRQWQEAAVDLPNIMFPGWVDPAQMHVLAELSSGFLAPYKGSSDFERSIPNKVLDALSLGLPIISPLRGEVADLIDRDGVGLRYGVDSNRTLYDCLVTLIDDQDLQRRMSSNALALYEERFTYEKVYGGLVEHLVELASARGSSDRG